MPFDVTNSPIGGAALFTGAAYAVFMWAIGGQIVGTRTIENLNWLPRCEQAVIQSAKASKPDLQAVPQVPNCNSFFGRFNGPETKALCDLVETFTKLPVENPIERANQRLQAEHQKRVADAAANAVSQCSCAKTVVLENRVDLALFAGSGRIVVPKRISNIEQELISALNDPVCLGRF